MRVFADSVLLIDFLIIAILLWLLASLAWDTHRIRQAVDIFTCETDTECYDACMAVHGDKDRCEIRLDSK